MFSISKSSSSPLKYAILTLAVVLTAAAAHAQPTFTKEFTPSTIGPGSVSTLRFDITNPSGTPAEEIAFTDNLPAGLSIATPDATTGCGSSAALSAPAGGTTISLTGGQLAPGASCSVLVDVVSSAMPTAGSPVTHMNVSGLLTSTLGSAGPATADLTVSADLPGLTKSFSPSTISPGQTSTVTLTIDNTANPSGLGTLIFNDNLPVGMVVASPAAASTDCGNPLVPPSLTAVSGSSAVSLFATGLVPSLPSVAAGASCTVTFNVTVATPGVYVNTTEDLRISGTESGKAAGVLDVALGFLAKSFVDDPVPPGGTVTLDFTITNFDRNFSATGIAFTDDLAATLSGLTFSGINPASNCVGSVLGVGTTLVDFSGGSLGPQASCTLSLSLSVPAGATPGAYLNTTNAVTATVDGSPVTGNMATDFLHVEPAPSVTKQFLGDPVSPGDPVVLEFTVTNTSSTSSATDISFEDVFSIVLPTASVPPPSECCGTGSTCTFTPLFNPSPPCDPCDGIPAKLTISGGNLAPAGMAGDFCTFSLTLDVAADAEPGNYPNVTSEVTATVDGATRVAAGASDDLTIVAAPSLRKAFTDDPVAPGGTVTLEFTLELSPNSPTAATGITFTDDLNAALTGLSANLPPSPDPPCGAGSTLTGSAGDTFLTFAGGSLMPGESCTFSVTLDVPAAATSGTTTNTTSGVSATVSGAPVTSAPATADLTVASLRVSKQFLGDPALPGDDVTLRFTIEKADPMDDVTSITFFDSLSSALSGLAAIAPLPVNPCGVGSVISGTTTLLFTGGNIPPGVGSCFFDVTVRVPGGAADGTYVNTTTNPTATVNGSGPVAFEPATGDLVVDSIRLSLIKAFTNDPVSPGDPVTLELTLSNLDAARAVSSVGFTDNLGAALAGLTFDSVGPDTCLGTVTGTGTSIIDVSGISLAAGASCVLQVSLSVPGGAAAGVYTNTTSTVTGLIGAAAVSGAAASDDLEVIQALLFSKSFDGPTTATGTATLTFTITNPGTDTATNIFFSDDLNAVIPGLIATGPLPALPCGAGSSITGMSFLTFTGGELPPMGGTCSFDVDVLVPATATAGTFPNTTSDLFQNGLKVANPATANLTIEPPPTFAKVFLPDTILAGGVSTLEFTIDNSASAVAANALAFTDNLPAGVVVATPSITSNGCGGSLDAVAGASTIKLTGSSGVGAGATCTIDVNVTSLAAGMYVNTTGDLTSSSGSSGFAENTLTVNPAADVSVTKSDGVTSAAPGASVTYEIVVANAGPSPDPSVTASDAFPSPPLTCTFTSVAAGGATGNTAAGAGDLAETLSLPAGSSVTYTVTCDIDSDATGTLSNTASITPSITDTVPGNNSATDDDTVLVPEADLSITKTDSADPVVPGDEVTYTLTVENAGPSDAHDVVVTDTLPAGVTFVETSGCPEDPNGVPTCTLGTITAGASKQLTVTVTIDNTANGAVTNEASVAASTAEANPGDETASETTTVNNGTPPSVTGVSTAAGPLAVCDSLRPPVSAVQVTVEDDLGPILHADELSSYLLVGTGPDGDFSTVACGSASGDDVEIEIVSLSLSSAGPTQVDVGLGLGGALGGGLYRFFVCDTITDAAGNALDGDGDTSPGVDFELSFFRTDPLNLFDDGHFDDCPVSLDPWISTVTAPNTITPGVAGTDDVDGSTLSASARISHSASPPSSLGQCVPVTGRVTYHLEARLRYDAVASALASFIARCELFDAAACAGTSLGTPSTAVLLEDVGGAWVTVGSDFTSPAGSASALCDFAVGPVGTDPGFDLYVDGLFLGGVGLIFGDGFESGDTSAWSSVVP